MSATWVLTYHSISHGPPPLCISPERFSAQLDRLLDASWRPVPLAEALDDRPDASSPGPRFAVTFDDGYLDFVDAALPALEQRGIPAVWFVSACLERSRLPGGIDSLPLVEGGVLRGLADAGVELAAHGIDHVALTGLGDQALAHELSAGREQIAEWSQQAVRYLAYPFGAFDARVLAAAAREFDAAFTTQLAAIPRSAARHAVPRIDAHYLDSPGFRRAIRSGGAPGTLAARRWLRRLRGSEPRRPIPSAALVRQTPARETSAWC